MKTETNTAVAETNAETNTEKKGENALTQGVRRRAKRNQSVPAERLTKAVVWGHKNSKTAEEVAKRLNMKLQSFNQRLFKLREQIENDEIPVPEGKTKAELYAMTELAHSGNGGRAASAAKDAGNVFASAFGDDDFDDDFDVESKGEQSEGDDDEDEGDDE